MGKILRLASFDDDDFGEDDDDKDDKDEGDDYWDDE